MEGTLSISDVPARVLFDYGSTHSSISPIFVACLVGEVAPLHCILFVSTPLGKIVQCESYYPACKVHVGSFILSADLIILGMTDFDVFLGMDRLSNYRAVMDCFNETVKLQVLKDNVEIVGERTHITTSGCEGR